MTSSNQGSPNKFVCPNDRQLALRAKLRTGWCVPRGVSPLTPAEQAAILEVIKRSEALGAAEARRVGKLVDRVECLRRASCVGGQQTAAGGARCAPVRCKSCSARSPLLAPLKTCSGCKHRFCNKCCCETAHNSDTWLCNLCSEIREMWKKSGAWFYHGLPQYILPERKDSASSVASLPVPVAASLKDLYEETYNRRNSEKGAPTYRSMSALQDCVMDNLENHAEELQHSFSRMSLTRLESFSRRSISSLKRTASGKSQASNSSLAGNAEQAAASQGVVQCPSQSQGTSAPPVPLNHCGTVEVRLLHDASECALHCTAIRARGLPSTDLAGLADPYCCMEVLPADGTTCSRQRTKTVHKTRNPEFNEIITFHGVSDADLDTKTFRVTLLDEDKYGCDILGSASLPLQDASLYSGRPQDLTLPLTAEDQLPGGLMKPQILVSLCYNTKKRALAVLICRCRNLPAMDTNGFSDPFVKLHLEPDPYHRKHKTSIKWRNLNPIFNEEFFFETRPTELSKQSLALTVWDKDYGKPNDFLGSLVIGCASKGKRLKHWLDCIKFPDHRHEQWHCLTETEP